MAVRLLLAFTVLSAALMPASALADPPKVDISQRYYDASGDPALIANVDWATNPSTPAWRTCAPDCGGVVATNSLLRPGQTPAGTVFQAESTVDGALYSSRSPAWQGRLANITPPAVTGDVRVGGVVSADGGTWSGGWGDDLHDLRLVACPDATTTSCVGIGSPYLATSSSAPVHPAYAGWYLRTLDTDVGPTPVSTAVGIIVTPGSTVTTPLAQNSTPSALSAPVGPIPPAATSTAGALTGTLAVGKTVTATSGSWPDQPAGGSIATGIRACPTRVDSTSCLLLTPIDKTAPTAKLTIGPNQLGWYLGTIDNHLWPNPWGPSTAFGDGKLPPPGPVVIDGPLSTTPVGLGFTPIAHLRTRAVAEGKRLVLGQLRCASRCVATATIQRGQAKTTTTVPITHGTRTLSILASRVSGRGSRLRVRVTFAGAQRATHATIRLP